MYISSAMQCTCILIQFLILDIISFFFFSSLEYFFPLYFFSHKFPSSYVDISLKFLVIVSTYNKHLEIEPNRPYNFHLSCNLFVRSIVNISQQHMMLIVYVCMYASFVTCTYICIRVCVCIYCVHVCYI